FLPILLLILITYFSITYKSDNPIIVTIITVQIPDYTLSSIDSTVSFTFTFHAAVTNPSRRHYSYSNTSSSLFYGRHQVGYIFIPGRHVPPGMENVMEVSMLAKSVPVSLYWYVPAMKGINLKQTMELNLEMKLQGRMTVFWVFSRRVDRHVKCLVVVGILDGSLLSFHC
ncbi:DNA polymerase III subunit alpha, partial [Bienertia sinuspersici]